MVNIREERARLLLRAILAERELTVGDAIHIAEEFLGNEQPTAEDRTRYCHSPRHCVQDEISRFRRGP